MSGNTFQIREGIPHKRTTSVMKGGTPVAAKEPFQMVKEI